MTRPDASWQRHAGLRIVGPDARCVRLPPPANYPEGGTPAERLDLAFRKVLTVPKTAILKEEGREKRQREKKKAAKKPH